MCTTAFYPPGMCQIQATTQMGKRHLFITYIRINNVRSWVVLTPTLMKALTAD